MIHLIILLHFACITIGSILLYELLKKISFTGINRLLIIGIGLSNLAFILDTINIYFRHWDEDYSLDVVIGILCSILVSASLLSQFIYLFQLAKRGEYSQKRSRIIAGVIFILCYLIQMICNAVSFLESVPWACLGYISFCTILVTYLFDKKNNSIPVVSATSEDAAVHKESTENLLTAREAEIAMYICDGKSNREIADVLFISQNTVRNHIYNIYKKMNVKNKVELTNVFSRRNSSV